MVSSQLRELLKTLGMPRYIFVRIIAVALVTLAIATLLERNDWIDPGRIFVWWLWLMVAYLGAELLRLSLSFRHRKKGARR